MTGKWVYFYGKTDGTEVKIGQTTRTLGERLQGIHSDQMNGDQYVLLAGVKGTTTAERAIHRYFEDVRLPKGRHREYFAATPEIKEYIYWLRSQHWTTSLDVSFDDLHEVEPALWLPRDDRRIAMPEAVDGEIWARGTQLSGPLAGTAWDWLPDPVATFQDYFTPPEIVACAEKAMGGIDLDIASHFLAIKMFRERGISIGDYYTVNRSAFDNPWRGNCWLNPPYGENERWFARLLEQMECGNLKQICFLSPAYAFITGVSRKAVSRADATILLSPTPEFVNPGHPERKGTNLPHMIFYWGNRATDFLTYYREFGIPLKLLPELA